MQFMLTSEDMNFPLVALPLEARRVESTNLTHGLPIAGDLLGPDVVIRQRGCRPPGSVTATGVCDTKIKKRELY